VLFRIQYYRYQIEVKGNYFGEIEKEDSYYKFPQLHPRKKYRKGGKRQVAIFNGVLPCGLWPVGTSAGPADAKARDFGCRHLGL
jgi:hypothetical protein